MFKVEELSGLLGLTAGGDDVTRNGDVRLSALSGSLGSLGLLAGIVMSRDLGCRRDPVWPGRGLFGLFGLLGVLGSFADGSWARLFWEL